MRSSREREQHRERARARTRSPGPISTKRVSRTTLRGRRRVTGHAACESQAVGGLGEPQREALAEEQEAVEEAARQLDVVVDHQQPVAAVGWMRPRAAG